MPTDVLLPSCGVERAALAFSILSSQCADVVNRRLTIGERMRLREGLARVRDATDDQRMEAMRLLAREVRRGGMEWPRPSVHNDADCPFGVLTTHPQARVVEVLERIATREPLEAAVTLCHLPADVRTAIWDAFTMEARAAVIGDLDEVHWVSTVRTRAYARDVVDRVTRAIRRGPAVVLA